METDQIGTVRATLGVGLAVGVGFGSAAAGDPLTTCVMRIP